MVSADRQNIPDEDVALVASWRRGNISSFESLVRKYQKKMLNIAFRIMDDYEDACEVTQDAFVSAYKEIDSFRGEASFSTWLTSITMNISRNRYRQTMVKRKNEVSSLDSAGVGTQLQERASSEPTALEQLELSAFHRRLMQCINDLSIEFRETLVLRDLQGYSYREICAILDLREGTVKSRLFRARDMIRDCLKKGQREA